MKKLFILTVALLAALVLVSCDTPAETTEDPALTDAPTDSIPETEPETEPPETEPPFDYDGYKTLAPTPSGTLQMLNVGFESHANALALPLPSGWSTYMQNGSLILKRNDTAIGEIVAGVPEDAPGTRVITFDEGKTGDITYYYNLLAIPTESNSERSFRHSITYTYDVSDTLYEITLTVNYTALDEYALEKCMTGAALLNKTSDPELGKLFVDGKSKPRRILVLGNSFVGTSEIGSFLSTMFSGTGYQVNAVSRGYACLCNGTWDDYIPRIRDGICDILFLCGFYHSTDAAQLDRFVSACRESGTELVLFPAHNESQEQSGMDAHPELPVLHWQDEIDMLIRELDIDYWDFCYNDQHKHSTPLAGYVGAQMIYRALTGKTPNAVLTYSQLPNAYINERLGDYVHTGYVTLLSDDDIWFLD